MSMCRLASHLALPLLLALVPSVGALPFFPLFIPNGTTNRCGNCHIDPAGGGPRNPFGLDFSDNGFTWDAALAAMDSDGDGFTNGEELQDPAGTWVPDGPQPGNPLLISSGGWPFSTPGERGIAISEVQTLPLGEQFIELTNRLDFPVNTADLILYSGEASFAIAGGATEETTIGPLSSKVIVVNSVTPTSECALCEPADGGLDTLGQSDFVALHWIADDSNLFDLYHTMIDYVQWGEAGQPREDVAEEAGEWEIGVAAPSPITGEVLAWDGIGEGVMFWRIAGASPGVPPSGLIFVGVLQVLLGQRTPLEIYDTNADALVNVADLVTIGNALSAESL